MGGGIETKLSSLTAQGEEPQRGTGEQVGWGPSAGKDEAAAWHRSWKRTGPAAVDREREARLPKQDELLLKLPAVPGGAPALLQSGSLDHLFKCTAKTSSQLNGAWKGHKQQMCNLRRSWKKSAKAQHRELPSEGNYPHGGINRHGNIDPTREVQMPSWVFSGGKSWVTARVIRGYCCLFSRLSQVKV